VFGLADGDDGLDQVDVADQEGQCLADPQSAVRSKRTSMA
jgi:hypothetical protein